MIIVPAAKLFISDELVGLWNEHFPGTTVTYGLHEFIIYYFNCKNLTYIVPEKKDILCAINLKQKKVNYYINEKLFETEKDYILALKNIAFL